MFEKRLRHFLDSTQGKAELLTAVFIALALPGYYKVRVLLEGRLIWSDILDPWAIVEVFYAFGLALILLGFYRITNQVFSGPTGKWIVLRSLLKISAAAVIALLFTRFFFNVVVEWGTIASFEFDVVLLAVMLPLLVSGVADKILLREKSVQAERAALIAQFETLKARISPHFLFNSLNTLVDIIEEDKALAVRFVEEMAKVYRYILAYRDSKLVPLISEVEAVRSLLFLHQTRRPGAIKVKIAVEDPKEQLRIVPMALQTLVENALKHNKYNPEEPISIDISVNQQRLRIKNSCNKKPAVTSTYEGLENLRRQVNFIGEGQLMVSEFENHFEVTVPLVYGA